MSEVRLSQLDKIKAQYQQDNAIGAFKEVTTYPNVLGIGQNVEICVGPNDPIDPEDTEALNAFSAHVRLNIPHQGRRPFVRKSIDNLALGFTFLREDLPVIERTRTLRYVLFNDAKLERDARAKGNFGITNEISDKPLQRQIVLRPYPNQELAVGVAEWEQNMIDGKVLPRDESMKLRQSLTSEQIAAIKNGTFKLPESIHLDEPILSTAEIAQRLAIMWSIEQIQDYINSPLSQMLIRERQERYVRDDIDME